MLLILLFLAAVLPSEGQGFLHADGKRIVDGEGANVILRGIGTGNWMLQEGYMMQTSDIAPTQHQFRDRLIQSIGQVNTDSFYVWLITTARGPTLIPGILGIQLVWVGCTINVHLPSRRNCYRHADLARQGFQLIDSADWCGDVGST
jgi:hypothetical protein